MKNIFYSKEDKDLDKIIDNENRLRAERTSLWFDQFIKNTNQKELTSRLFTSLIRELKKNDLFYEDYKLIDVGCGEGKLANLICSNLVNQTNKVSYYGIDYDYHFVEQTNEILNKLNLRNLKVIHGDCFSDDIDQLPDDVNLIIISNIVYYAKDINQFVSKIERKLADNSLFIFVHESPNSDMNILRTKYQAPIDVNTVTNINNAFKDDEITNHKIIIESALVFPEITVDLLNDNFLSTYRFLDEDNDKYFLYYKIKMLLEFVVQTPLESLEDKNMLEDFFTDIKKLLTQQDNKLIIRSGCQLALSKNHSKSFETKISKAMKEMEKDFSPSTIISYYDASIDNIHIESIGRA